MKHQGKLQDGWTLKTLCQVKETSHKRPCIVGFHLYKMSRVGKFVETEAMLVVAQGWGCRGGRNEK